jgi:hypothetical protein
MLPAIEFNVEHRFEAKEIEHVRRIRMLTAEFVNGKTTIAKPAPQ